MGADLLDFRTWDRFFLFVRRLFEEPPQETASMNRCPTMRQLMKAPSAKAAARKNRLRDRLRLALEEFFASRMGGHRDFNIKIVDDLILLRCKEALSPAEMNLASMKAGRLLLQEVSERLCHELQPDLNRVLYQITGLRLLDIGVGSFWQRGEKIYLLNMSNKVKL